MAAFTIVVQNILIFAVRAVAARFARIRNAVGYRPVANVVLHSPTFAAAQAFLARLMGPAVAHTVLDIFVAEVALQLVAAAEVRRNAERGCHAVCFSEIAPNLGLPSIHTG